MSRGPRSTASGLHFLRSKQVGAELVASAGIGPDHLVIDFGAAVGSITTPLAETGARVLAVERDRGFVERLTKKFTDDDKVRVVDGDPRSIPLPRRKFWVVSSLPKTVSDDVLRRLLNPTTSPFAGAELALEFGVAKKLTAAHPTALEVAWWASRFDIRVRRRLPATNFQPNLRGDAAHVSIRRREGFTRQTDRVLWALLHAAYGAPERGARTVLANSIPGNRAKRMMTEVGVPGGAPAEVVTIQQWSQIAKVLGQDKTLSWPAIPKTLDKP
ncbi:methyltransferase domain-containing protein [Allokutzneria sp. A3M-2-11 16]|uniref:rRNA adenine N-6-methyltransferase family protein n=1 Tax=Allokutzneria sp. A3M-2-11 16 TaxID=2962043 RepID=UPI0020B7FBF2|nr:rRNA adenine N-6-methyltransferase family protein [Allokutzneria sp. A3M-2-11 16]MCP3802122.1 methyltransferase domain-containing protein [Allokutzneria sp. A3M-2-11 16]